jgi:hypothetical protein
MEKRVVPVPLGMLSSSQDSGLSDGGNIVEYAPN